MVRMQAGFFSAIRFNPRAYALLHPSNIIPGHRSKSARHRPADRCRAASPAPTAGIYCSPPRSPHGSAVDEEQRLVIQAQLHTGGINVKLTGYNLSHSRYLQCLGFGLFFAAAQGGRFSCFRYRQAMRVLIHTHIPCRLLVEGRAPKPPLNTEFHSVAARSANALKGCAKTLTPLVEVEQIAFPLPS